MKDAYQELGSLLRILRKQSGRTQEDIAKQLGVTRSTYTYYETGKILPNVLSLRRLAEIFQVPVEMLVYPERYLPKR